MLWNSMLLYIIEIFFFNDIENVKRKVFEIFWPLKKKFLMRKKKKKKVCYIMYPQFYILIFILQIDVFFFLPLGFFITWTKNCSSSIGPRKTTTHSRENRFASFG